MLDPNYWTFIFKQLIWFMHLLKARGVVSEPGNLYTINWHLTTLYWSFRCVWSCVLCRDWARPGATGGAYRGRAPPTDCLCPPKRKLCPPKRGLCPEENNGLGAFGAQIEAQINVFCGLSPVLWRFWDEDLFFFLKSPVLGNQLNFRFRPENPLKFQWRPLFFFFGDHLFSIGKFLWLFAPHLVPLIQTGINFSCPRAPFEFTQNKYLTYS